MSVLSSSALSSPSSGYHSVITYVQSSDWWRDLESQNTWSPLPHHEHFAQPGDYNDHFHHHHHHDAHFHGSNVCSWLPISTYLYWDFYLLSWVGGGNPCGAADFWFSCRYCQKKPCPISFPNTHAMSIKNVNIQVQKREQGNLLVIMIIFQW